MTSQNESLAAFIKRRRQELDDAEARLRADMSAIAEERGQLERAGSAAGIVSTADTPPTPHQNATIPRYRSRNVIIRRTKRVVPERTIKEAVLAVLAEVKGMTALEILAAINKRLGVNYPRTSLSPQLSRLKAAGKIKRKGIVWSLTRAGKIEVAGEHSEQEPPATSDQQPGAQGREAGPGGGT